MELHKAIKKIVASKGTEMINNIQIINYLLDYQAFKEKPATKLILRAIIDSGYSRNILALVSKPDGWQTKFKQYQHNFIESYGFKEDLVKYVFESIASGLTLTDNLSCLDKTDNSDSVSHNIQKEHDEIIECETYTRTETTNGVPVGSIAGLKLPSGEIIAVKLEIIKNGMVGIRTKGFNRYLVSEGLIVPCNESHTTLPQWYKVGTILSNGLTIVDIDHRNVKLSDGKNYKHIDILLNYTPQ